MAFVYLVGVASLALIWATEIIGSEHVWYEVRTVGLFAVVTTLLWPVLLIYLWSLNEKHQLRESEQMIGVRC